MLRYSTTAFLALGFLLALPSLAKDPVFSAGGFAIRGFDPVAYFETGAPAKGKKEISYEWNGAIWLFSKESHREAFVEDPERFSPQFGGYCAYAVAKGSTAPIDPKAWEVVDGKLYLNYSPKIQSKWSKDAPGYIAKGEANWPGVLE